MADNSTTIRDYEMYERKQDPNLMLENFLMDYLVTIVYTVGFTAVLAATLVFVYAFYRFKKLRTTPNFILLNYFVCDFVYTLLGLLSLYFECFETLSTTGFESLTGFLVFLLSLLLIFFIAAILIMFLLGFDWFLSANYPEFRLKYPNYDRWAIAGVYLICSVNILINFTGREITKSIQYINLFCILLSVLIIAVLFCWNKCKSYSQEVLKTSYRFSISLAYILLWFSEFVVMKVSEFWLVYNISYKKLLIATCFYYFIVFIAVLAPVMILVWLIRRDDHFKACIDYMCKKTRGIHEELEEEPEV